MENRLILRPDDIEAQNISPTIAAVGTLLILFTAALMMVLKWLRGRAK